MTSYREGNVNTNATPTYIAFLQRKYLQRVLTIDTTKTGQKSEKIISLRKFDLIRYEEAQFSRK